MPKVLSMVLAGGEGSRLYPLTQSRTKPSVPFGGSYRLIDCVLNNFVNSDLLRIYVLTQFKSQSLNEHLRMAWELNSFTDTFIDAIPAQMRTGKHWYSGTADAIYQNIQFIESDPAKIVCVFGSDHIYKMDIRQKIRFHNEKNAVLTVSAIRLPKEQAFHFGIIEVDEEGRMIGFAEKPAVEDAKTIPGDPDYVLASMGNYVFNSKALQAELIRDAADENSSHDFGKDIIPHLVPGGKVFVYDFTTNTIPKESGETYWRDVGTIESYWEANMDLVKETPPIDFYNRAWPMHTYYPALPAANFQNNGDTTCTIRQSLISDGCQITAATIKKSVLGFNCFVGENSNVLESVFLGDISIGKNCVITKTIIDKDVEIADGVQIGVNLEDDKKRFTVSDEGIVVIPKGAKIGF
ncbi:glucose-1-phosphate adenylyltransferase [Psychromonas sp. RZ22]|uniref:glucose-1-phosphate adenylyltransferase n=1 Tax=Psychromonas algarum TaxID=2555643 RepID=UPI0010689657|nr:glucose-1-phosphate adenylyltransferase [Psychromonas sp. RZ22]TEW56748.1 glucose-1-phosphate adenylyltransferase [Psychromonas sp. RZ22]